MISFMINPPITLLPCFCFILIATLCFAAWGRIIPLPGWMQVLGLYLGIASFVMACVCGLDWATDRVTRYANVDDLLDPMARTAEAIIRMNERQLAAFCAATGVQVEPINDSDYVMIDETGEAVLKSAVLAIDHSRKGINLQAERDYTAQQHGIRAAHDAFTRAGYIEPAAGRRGPRLKNLQRWEKVVELANGRGS